MGSLLLAAGAFTIVTTTVLLVLALLPHDGGAGDVGADGRPRIRLLSQVLFARRQRESITIDCLLVRVEQAGPGVGAPSGLPFTLRFHTPDTAWFADRVEHLLSDWADENRELTFELREDHGKVRTMITNGASAVHLELAGAAGLSLTS